MLGSGNTGARGARILAKMNGFVAKMSCLLPAVRLGICIRCKHDMVKDRRAHRLHTSEVSQRVFMLEREMQNIPVPG
jgi:hypothetical protein